MRVEFCEDESMERIQTTEDDCLLYHRVSGYSLVEFPIRAPITEPRWPMRTRLAPSTCTESYATHKLRSWPWSDQCVPARALESAHFCEESTCGPQDASFRTHSVGTREHTPGRRSRQAVTYDVTTERGDQEFQDITSQHRYRYWIGALTSPTENDIARLWKNLAVGRTCKCEEEEQG